MKKMKNSIQILAAVALLSIASCSDDDDVTIINEEELITTVELELTNQADATNVAVFRSVDSDGDSGPNAPVITFTGTVNANATYNGTVRFLNESIAPSENITEEVIEEADEHEVFYISTLSDVSVAKTDVDSNGNPLGVQTTFQTGAVGTGVLNVVLRHEPTKPNDNTLSGAGGESDVEVAFTFEVE